ncbi:unnamed protein product [Hymenolepis diminuta]|uniref:Uncharacterized protein n=1 Tax=Hymenolepis diminuta TaxID=6216 RepID=A0A564XYR8_HYMDI|nr:unnamed protein product [Hymenolepis diminuta]
MFSSGNCKYSGTYTFKSKESLRNIIRSIEYRLQSEFIPPFAIDYVHNGFIINGTTKLSIGVRENEYMIQYEFPTYYSKGWKICENIIEDIRLYYEEE